PAHLSYAEVIEERLKSAKAVLVLWSAEAAKSQWVRAEADAARELGTLIQSSVDGTVPPIPFNQIQCANLKGWNGEDDHAGWRKLKSSVVALAGQVEETVKASKKRATSSICVLPFQNMSGDAVPDYFSDGISEDIISDLSKVSALSVVPRKTAFAFKGQEVDAASVAEKLSVAYVLEGTVRKAGERVRITAQLVDAGTGENAWSDRYYREFNDIFSVQDEISQAIIDALKIKLLPAEKKAIKEGKASSEADGARSQSPPQEDQPDEAPSAFQFGLHNGANSEAELEVQEPHIAVPEESLAEEYVQDEPPAAEEWSAGEEWDPDEESESGAGWRSRRYGSSERAPRLIGLGLVALLVAVLVGYFYWPDRSAPVVEEKNLSYSIIATVNVRSLPSRYNSRILGTLEKGVTINVVPDLAGAQPDWLKIEDGPYVGGYVWRESTRPISEGSATDAQAKVNNTALRKDVTG
ncbi:MAG: TIR domain-containing protein, partial [Sphingomicrobium sp.]